MTRSFGCAPISYTVSRRAERAHHCYLRLGLSRRRPGAPRGACPDGGRPARRRPGGGLSSARCISTTGCCTHVRYVARETYDQTAYAAVCEGEAVCGGIADAYVYLLERGGIPARVITGTSRIGSSGTSRAATPGSRRSSTARSITSTPPGICRTTRARRRCRATSATRGSPSRPSAWPCATRPTIPPSGRTAAPTRITTTSAAVTRRRRPPSPPRLPPCAASGTTGAPCWSFAARRRRSTPACSRAALRTRPALGCLPRARQLRVLVRLPVRGRPADHPPYPRALSLPPAGGKRCEAF